MGSALPDRASGCDFDGGVEVDLTRGATRNHCPMTRPRWAQPVFSHATQMELNRHLHTPERGVDRLTRGYTAGKVWNRRPPVAVGVLVNAHQILDFLHDSPRFNPACRLTDANVPLGMSSPRLPLTVTRPGFTGCLNCRWLPRVTT